MFNFLIIIFIIYICSIFGTHLHLFSQRTYGSEEILNINHDLLITLRWFSIGSQTIAHWTFFCSPDGKFDNTFKVIYCMCMCLNNIKHILDIRYIIYDNKIKSKHFDFFFF